MDLHMDYEKQYAERDPRGLGDYYLRHLSAMTGEKLHEKNEIAAELAYRDQQIDELVATLVGIAEADTKEWVREGWAQEETEHFEFQEWAQSRARWVLAAVGRGLDGDEI